VVAAHNEVCLTPLDQPVVLEYPNGDRRPLLLGVLDVRARLVPQDHSMKNASCQLNFGSGWHAVEQSGSSWIRWNAGHGRLNVLADSDIIVTLRGNINSMQRPNEVDVLLNGERLTALRIDWDEWAFEPFTPLTLTLKSGQNNLEFISHNPPVTQTTDLRPLAIAIKDLQLLRVDDQPCVIQP
jgi:hypothetical protein